MAMIPWERLVAQCEEYGVLGVAHGLTDCPRRVRSEEDYGRYQRLSATFPCVALWKAWLYNGSVSTDCFSIGHLVDEDLRLLYKGFSGMDTEGTPARLHAVKALGMQDLYFVDVEQWRGDGGSGADPANLRASL